MYVAKIKALISNRATDLRLCFRIRKNMISHDAAHLTTCILASTKNASDRPYLKDNHVLFF